MKSNASSSGSNLTARGRPCWHVRTLAVPLPDRAATAQTFADQAESLVTRAGGEVLEVRGEVGRLREMEGRVWGGNTILADLDPKRRGALAHAGAIVPALSRPTLL